MLRDRTDTHSGPFGGLLALSAAAAAITPVVAVRSSAWLWPIQIVSMATPALLWSWAGAVFIDDFRPSWRDGCAWALLAAISVLGLYAWQPWIGIAGWVAMLAFVALTAWRLLIGRRGDLVERRRRLRLVLAVLAVAYAGGLTVMDMLALDRPGKGTARVAEAAAFAALAAAFAFHTLRVARPLADSPVVEAVSPEADEAVGPAAAIDDQEEALLARLRHLMETEKAYRQEGSDLASLAATLAVPEYRLRRLINQRLGHRNFSSFINGYRLDEAVAALADPGQAAVPILTIALDSGFQSIGPFNRAFKARTGMTPTAYRKQAESRNH